MCCWMQFDTAKATFLLLSFSKILFVSFTLLHTISVHYCNSDIVEKKGFMYYDATVECSTHEYHIFVVIAVCVLVIFIVFPTVLLLVYPTKLFRRCVTCCGFQSWHALHMFVESFQGQYKDGTNGTRDFRMVSAFFLIFRILTVASLSPHDWSIAKWNPSVVRGVFFVSSCCSYAIMRPYRLNYRNNVDILVLALLAILSLIVPTTLHHPEASNITYGVPILTLMLGVPHMVLMFFLCYKLAKITGLIHCLNRKYTVLKSHLIAIRHTFQTQRDREAVFNTDSLPDRMINPGEYDSMLHAPMEHPVAEPTENKGPASEEARRITPVYTYGSIN